MGVVEGDGLDRFFPGETADVDSPEGGLEPVDDPGFVGGAEGLGPGSDLGQDGVGVGGSGEDSVVDPGWGARIR